MKLDLYVINYHTAKQKIESYYKVKINGLYPKIPLCEA